MPSGDRFADIIREIFFWVPLLSEWKEETVSMTHEVTLPGPSHPNENTRAGFAIQNRKRAREIHALIRIELGRKE